MARGTVSTLIKTSISALRIWCDGSHGPPRCPLVKTHIIHTHKRLEWNGIGRWKRALTLGEKQWQ